MNLTVACVLVKGHVGFTPEYVMKLRQMALRALPQHRFVCLTDGQASLPGIETITVAKPSGIYAWWSKVELFNPAHKALQEGRILYLDLDVLIVDRLEEIVNFAPGMAIAPDGAPNFVGKGNLKTVKLFNSSVMSWNGGSHHSLFTNWTPDVARRLWGDQDWIGEQHPEAATMPLSWFPRLSQVTSRGKVDKLMQQAKVILCKKPKNVEAAALWPWFAKAWH